MPAPKPLNIVDLGHIVHFRCEVSPELLLLLDSSSHMSRVATMTKCVSRLKMSRSIHPSSSYSLYCLIGPRAIWYVESIPQRNFVDVYPKRTSSLYYNQPLLQCPKSLQWPSFCSTFERFDAIDSANLEIQQLRTVQAR